MKKLYLICAILSFLIVACAVFLFFEPVLLQKAKDKNNEQTEQTRIVEKTEQTEEQTLSPVEELIVYECPEKLTEQIKKNQDVYAWITIDGTNVDFPIVQSPTNDSYYLRRGLDGKYSISGSIMTEHTYNTTTFEDPVTLIYGHCMDSGAMFGQLQKIYSDEQNMRQNGKIEIFTKDKKHEYTVFAAVPYDTRHILYYYDFSDPSIYSLFFDGVYSTRSFNTVVINENKPEIGDKVIILSTCLNGDSSYRYLVMAKENK